MDFYININARSCGQLVNLLILIRAKNVSKENFREKRHKRFMQNIHL